MNDTRLTTLHFRNTLAQQLFERVASYEELDMIQCEEDYTLIFPTQNFIQKPLDEKLKSLADERADILFASIDIQEQIARAGKERTVTLCMEKDRLISIFNDDALIAGLNTDIRQQSTDMAIMTTMSHSALMFAKTFAPTDAEKIEKYGDKVMDMRDSYKDFSARLNLNTYTFSLPEGEHYAAPADAAKQLRSDIEEVKELNIMLATMVQNRFENGIRSLYFWQEKLGQKPQTVLTGNDFFDKFCNPRHEWEYEVDVQGLMSERVKILTTRAQHMDKYADLIDKLTP